MGVLTPKRVEMIRTSELTDAHWARVWRVAESTVRNARTGVTWPDHPTPPDTRPRDFGGGRKAGPKARIIDG
jgi:hypothetical protein